MSFEDEVAAAMRAHDHEAPTGITIAAPRRHTRWLAAAAAVAAVLIVATAVALFRLRGSGTDTGGTGAIPATSGVRGAALPPASCPTHFYTGTKAPEGWVPRPPPAGIAAGRLAPTAAPGSVTICSYVGGRVTGSGSDARVALTARHALGGDLAAVTGTLAFEPRREPGQSVGCTADLKRTDGDNYLIAVTYRSGTVWVSVPGDHCKGSANGTFASAANLRAVAAASLQAGRWVPDPRPDALPPHQVVGVCERGSAGRLGQDTALVPAGVSSVDLCVGDGNGTTDGRAARAYHLSAAQAAALISDLDALPTEPSTDGCVQTAQRTTVYRLHFHYPVGPDTDVFVTAGCRPAIDNLSLQATSDGRVVAMVQALAG